MYAHNFEMIVSSTWVCWLNVPDVSLNGDMTIPYGGEGIVPSGSLSVPLHPCL